MPADESAPIIGAAKRPKQADQPSLCPLVQLVNRHLERHLVMDHLPRAEGHLGRSALLQGSQWHRGHIQRYAAESDRLPRHRHLRASSLGIAAGIHLRRSQHQTACAQRAHRQLSVIPFRFLPILVDSPVLSLPFDAAVDGSSPCTKETASDNELNTLSRVKVHRHRHSLPEHPPLSAFLHPRSPWRVHQRQTDRPTIGIQQENHLHVKSLLSADDNHDEPWGIGLK